MTEQQIQTEGADVWERLRRRINEMRRGDRSQIDPDVLARKLANRARMLRGRIGKAEPAVPQISFLAFCSGPQRYGLPVFDIVDVQQFSNYTPVPGAPAFVPGVIQWRGAIVSLVDLAKLFGIAELGLVDERVCIFVEAGGRRIGVLASEVQELCSVPLDQVKSAPDLHSRVPPEWIIGVYDHNRLILKPAHILSDQRLVAWK